MSQLRDLISQKSIKTRAVVATALDTSAPVTMSLRPAQREVKESEVNYDFKVRIHERLIDNIDVNVLIKMAGDAELEEAISKTIKVLIDEERLPLSAQERENLSREVLYETLGLGPLEPLLSDESVNDILVNGASSVWVDRDGKLVETSIHFKDDKHLLHVINRIVSRVGRRIDESSPIVDARLPDGSRVNAIIPPLALDGPVLSIRRFRPVPFAFEDLIGRGALTEPMADFLKRSVKARLNILISGGTSAGKTTLLNVLSANISNTERIVTIEDTAELRLQQRHVIRLESRPANVEGEGAVKQRELVKNALRMRPDRIILGEVRGAEALDMLQAMNTGHEGSLTTVHANSARDALSRIETLVLLSGVELSQRSIREQIGAAFDLVVQVKRLSDGRRRVVSISEVTGVQEGVISMQDIFEFKQTGSQEDGSFGGHHRSCGIRPAKANRFAEQGIELPVELFKEDAI
jgi:pilus assembly protein CpaF